MNIRKYFTWKKITAVIIILALVGFFVFRSKNSANSNVQTDTVKRVDLKKTVLATGTVVSGVDLSLSFKASGVVKSLPALVGKKVKQGEVLAELSNSSEAASLTQARGSLAQAQANLRKIMDGASSEEVQVAQKAVDSAQVNLENAKKNLTTTKNQNDVTVKNAYSTLINSGLAAYPAFYNKSTTPPTVTGVYTGDATGEYKISVVSTGSNQYMSYSGIETGTQTIDNYGAPTKLGTKGLYLTFVNINSFSDGDVWTVPVPNLKASNYNTNLNAYNAALEAQKSSNTTLENAISTAQAAVDQAVAQLAQKKAEARPAEIAAAQAQVLSAQGQVQAASASIENTILRAPIDGTITAVDIKLGEQAQAQKGIITLQNLDSLHVESNISEANIAQLKPNQKVVYSFDAFGPDRKFEGNLLTVDPASTVQSGVVNYKVTTSLPSIPELKPGLTTNLTILLEEHPSVLTIPSRAVLDKDGVKVVRVINDPKLKTYTDVQVTVGISGDAGLIEILSGLDEGQEIVTLVK